MAVISQAPAPLDLVAVKGDDLTITLTITENGIAYDWTGATVATSITDNTGTAVATNFTTATPASGTLTLTLNDTQTSTLGVATYRWQVNVTKASATRTWLAGALSVMQPGWGGTSTSSASLSITTGAGTVAIGGGVTGATGTAATIAVGTVTTGAPGSAATVTNAGTSSAAVFNFSIPQGVAGATVASGVSVADTADRYAATNVETALAEVATIWKHKPSRSFMQNLALVDRPTTFVVMADSTSNGTDEWAYLTAQWLGTQFPGYTIHHRLWNDTTQGWDSPTVVQTGTAGEAYFTMGTTDSRSFGVSDSATLSPAGDISVRVKMRRANWSSAATAEVFNKFGTAGNRSWQFYIDASGFVSFAHSADGTNLKSQTSSAAVSFSANATGWIRADLDVDNGATQYAVTFYTSTDGTTWTQLGTTKTGAGVSSVFDSTAQLLICNRGGTNGGGDIFAADLYNGIGANNTLIASWRAGEMWRSGSATGVIDGYDVCGNLWSGNSTALTQGITGAPVLTVRNASVSGQALSYFTDVTRFPKINTGRVRMTMISLSHNEGGTYVNTQGDLYYTNMSSFLSQITTLNAATAIVLHGQNPKASPVDTDAINGHKDRIRGLAELAANLNHGFVDAYTAMVGNEATYVSAVDGVHPTTAGSALWATLTQRFLLNC